MKDIFKQILDVKQRSKICSIKKSVARKFSNALKVANQPLINSNFDKKYFFCICTFASLVLMQVKFETFHRNFRAYFNSLTQAY